MPVKWPILLASLALFAVPVVAAWPSDAFAQPTQPDEPVEEAGGNNDTGDDNDNNEDDNGTADDDPAEAAPADAEPPPESVTEPREDTLPSPPVAEREVTLLDEPGGEAVATEDGTTLLPATVEFTFQDELGEFRSWDEYIPDLRDPERMHNMLVTVWPYAFEIVATFVDAEGIYRQHMRISGERLVVWHGYEAPEDGRAVPLEFFAAGNVRVTFERERLDGEPLTRRDRALAENVLRFEEVFFSLSEVRGVASRARVRLRQAGQESFYLRARELRMLSLDDTVAEDVAISMTPYLMPQLYLHADEVRFRRRQDVSVVDVEGTRLMYRDRVISPFFDQSQNLSRSGFLRSTSVEESDRFGFAFNVEVDLWLLLHDRILGRQWHDTFTGRITGGVHYYSERGLAPRTRFRWVNDSLDGGAFAFFIHDSGDDTDFGRDRGFFPLEDPNRLRLRAWHQQEFPLELHMAAHFSYFSDENLLFEFFNPEISRQENQDTYLELTRYDPLSGIRIFANYQINNSVPTIEYLPRVQFFIYPSRLLTIPGINASVYLQLRTDVAHIVDRPVAGSGEPRVSSTRLDLRPGLIMPIDLGVLGFSQAFTLQTSWYGWDVDVNDMTLPQRIAIESRTSLYTNVFRTFEVNSDSFNLDGLRHVIRPELVYLHRFPVTYLHGMDAESIPQFDDIDLPLGVHDELTLYLTTILEGRRQSVAPGQARIRDIVTLRGEMSFFPRPSRDNDGSHWGPLIGSFDFRPQDWITFHADMRYDWSTSTVTRYGVGGTLHVLESRSDAGERSRRTHVSVSMRHRVVQNVSSISRLAVQWRPSESYFLRVAAEYDFEQETIRNASLTMSRLFQEFSLTVRVRRDFVRDDTSLFFTFEPSTLFQ